MPLTPSTSTRQSRHEPNGSRLSVAHSLGTSTPASAAARITDVPSRHADGLAVDLERPWRRRCGPACRGRAPRAGSCRTSGRCVAELLADSVIGCSGAGCRSASVDRRPRAGGGAARSPKSSEKCRIALRTGIGVRPPIAHSDPSVITSHRSSSTTRLSVAVAAGDDPVDHLDAAHASRCGTACTCRTTPRRRTPSRTAPAAPCRRCRRRRRRRRARPSRRPRRTPRSPSAGRSCSAGR